MPVPLPSTLSSPQVQPQTDRTDKIVYLELKDIFQGANSQIRQPKSVRNAIEKHQGQTNIRRLIQDHGMDRVCSIAGKLLVDGVFESTVKAKSMFPGIFAVTPVQNAQRCVSEKVAEKHENTAIRHVADKQPAAVPVPTTNLQNNAKEPEEKRVAEKHENTATQRVADKQPAAVPVPTTKPQNNAEEQEGKKEQQEVGNQQKDKPLCQHCSHELSIGTPSLYPIYLPLDVQYRLLSRTQALLESACFTFAQAKLSSVIEKEGWECAEAVELNYWSKILLDNKDKFDVTSLERLQKPLPEILTLMADLRHAAVHRVRLTANRAIQFMSDGILLVRLMQVDTHLPAISSIHRHTLQAVQDLETNKDLLEARLAETRRQYTLKRAELDREELEEIQIIAGNDRDYATITGKRLEEALDKSETVIYSPSITEESSSDGESDSSTTLVPDTEEIKQSREEVERVTTFYWY